MTKQIKILIVFWGIGIATVLGFQNCAGPFQTGLTGEDAHLLENQSFDEADRLLLQSESAATASGSVVACPAAEALKNTNSSASQSLQDCVDRMSKGQILELSPGRYLIDRRLTIKTPGITIRTKGQSFVSEPCADSISQCAELAAHPQIDSINSTFIATEGGPSAMVFSVADDVHLDHLIFNGNKEARAKHKFNHPNRSLLISMFANGNKLTNSIAKDSIISSAIQFPAWGGKKLSGIQVLKNRVYDNGLHDYAKDPNGSYKPGEAAWADGMIAAMLANSKVIGNYFADNTDVDLIFWGCQNCQITDNVIYHSKDMYKSSFAALHLGVAVDLPSSPDFQAESGDYSGTVVARNQVDCGPNKACGYGLLVGVFFNHRVDAVRAVSGAKVYDNTVTNSQQGISIHHAQDIYFANNKVSKSGIKDQTYVCSSGKHGQEFQWSAFNISASYVKNLDRSKDPLKDIPYTSFNDSCTPNAAMYYRSGSRVIKTQDELRDEHLSAIRALSMKYFGQISKNHAAVEKQLAFLASGKSLSQLESYFALIDKAWNDYLGRDPDYHWVDHEMSLLIDGKVTESALRSAIKAEAEKIKAAGNQTPAHGSPSEKTCTFNGKNVSHGASVTAFAKEKVPSGQNCQSQSRTCTNGTLSGSYVYSSCQVEASDSAPVLNQCKDRYLMHPLAGGWTIPNGVHKDIKTLYDDVLNGIGPHLEGARYLSKLYAQGYTLLSLRRDLVNDSAVLDKVNSLYQAYLKRNIHPSDYNNVKNALINGKTLRFIELQIVNSEECKEKANP